MLHRIALALFLAWNTAAAPPLLVIALDGVRHDFPEKYSAGSLLELAENGARVRQMLPVFPSTTFPNFYSMATGLLPERNGMAGMMFIDPATGERFQFFKNSREGKWYRGTPFWQLAEEQGIKTGAFHWVGSDAGINGRHPTAYRPYDSRVTPEEKLQTVVDWIKSGFGLVLVYFSDVDSAGHTFGPDSQQVREAVARVDEYVKNLVTFSLMANPDINILIVSDHGQTGVRKVIDVSNDADFTGCRSANEGPLTRIYCKDPARVAAVQKALTGKSSNYTVRRTTGRAGDLLILPTGAFIPNVLIPGDDAEPVKPIKGMHGYDGDHDPDMRGILIGYGPAFRKGATVSRARNEDVFALVAKILGLKTPQNLDADLNRVRGLLSAH
jgi:alkaline phosphatase D